MLSFLFLSWSGDILKVCLSLWHQDDQVCSDSERGTGQSCNQRKYPYVCGKGAAHYKDSIYPSLPLLWNQVSVLSRYRSLTPSTCRLALKPSSLRKLVVIIILSAESAGVQNHEPLTGFSGRLGSWLRVFLSSSPLTWPFLSSLLLLSPPLFSLSSPPLLSSLSSPLLPGVLPSQV